MASVAIEKNQPAADGGEMWSPPVKARGGGGEGLRQYYTQHIHDLQLQLRQKSHNLNRLEAQRNDLNSKGQLLNPNPKSDHNPKCPRWKKPIFETLDLAIVMDHLNPNRDPNSGNVNTNDL